MHFKLIVLLVLAALALLFIVQNVAVMEIQFLFWSAQLPRSLMILLVLLLGLVMGWVLHSLFVFRKTRREQASDPVTPD